MGPWPVMALLCRTVPQQAAGTTIERCYKLLFLQTSIWVLARAKESNLPNCIRKQRRVATRQQRSMMAPVFPGCHRFPSTSLRLLSSRSWTPPLVSQLIGETCFYGSTLPAWQGETIKGWHSGSPLLGVSETTGPVCNQATRPVPTLDSPRLSGVSPIPLV